MGLFDFIFGKKDSSFPTSRRPHHRDVFNRSAGYNRQWRRIIEDRIVSQKAAGRTLDYNLSNEYYAKRSVEYMLQGHMVGSKMGSVEMNRRSAGHEYRSAFSVLGTLFDGTDEFDEYIRTTRKGLVHLMVDAETSKRYDSSSTLLSYLLRISNEEEGYYTSLMLDLMDTREIRRYLYLLMQSYIQMPEDNFANVKVEILNRIGQNNIPKEVGASIFDNQDLLQSYLDLRRAQYLANNRSKKVNAQWETIYENWTKSMVSPEAHLLLLSYELFNNYSKTDGDKLILKDLTDRSSMGYESIHTILRIFNSKTQNGNLVSGTWVHKIIKDYFVNEPLDPKSYTLIKQAIEVCDTISRAKKLNDFLYSKSGALYKIHGSDVHQLLHAGELHHSSISNHYGGNKDATTYINNVIALINQIIPAVMLKEEKNAYNVRVGVQEVSLGTKELHKLNKALAEQGVPYQLVDVPMTYAQNTKQSSFKSTLMLNEDQFELIQGHIDTRLYSKVDQINYKDLRFVETVGEAEPLNNVVSKLKKSQSSSVASNRFIHDIKWKDVKIDVVDELANPRLWYGAMHHIVSAPNTVRPSATWTKKMQSIKNELESDEYAIGIIRLVQHMEDNDIWFTKDNLKALRGMIWASTLLEEDLAFAQIESICQRCFQKIPGIGPKSTSGGNCCIAALVDMETPKAYSSLVRIQSEANYDRLKNQISDELRTFEHKFKSKVTALKEAAQEDYGFVDGVSKMVVEDYEIRWEIKNYKTKSRWYDRAGNKLSKTPQIKDYSITQTISAKTKEINQGVDKFYSRMQEYRFSDVRWSIVDWKHNYLNHGFVGQVMDRLLWIVERTDGQRDSFIVRNGKVIDFLNNTISLDAEEDTVRLYHKTLVLDEINEAWKLFFAKHRIKPVYEYFYGQDDNNLRQEEVLDNVNNYFVNGQVGNWITIREPQAEYFTLPFIHKIVVLQNVSKEIKPIKNEARIDYYELPEYLPRYRYNWEDLVEKVDVSAISATTHYEIMNDVILGLTWSGIRGGGFVDLPRTELLKIPLYRELDKLFKKIIELQLIPGLNYEDFRLKFNGPQKSFLVDLRTMKLEIPEREGPSRFYGRGFHGVPKVDYENKVGMPIKLDSRIQDILWIIPNLIEGKRPSGAYRLDEWINKI